MSTEHEKRSVARRIASAMKMSISINGAPFISAQSIDFTYRSVAIRTDKAVRTGSLIDIAMGELPVLSGVAVRTFEGGCAVKLNQPSLAMLFHATDAEPELDQGVVNAQRVIGPTVRLEGPSPAWGRMVTSLRDTGPPRRTRVTIISTDSDAFDKDTGFWVYIAKTGWAARVARAYQRGPHYLTVLNLNELQLKLAADFGISFSRHRNPLPTDLFTLPAHAVRNFAQMTRTAALSHSPENTVHRSSKEPLSSRDSVRLVV